MPEPDSHKDDRLARRYSGAITADGRHFLFTFERMDNSTHEILIPFDSIVDLIMLFEGSSRKAIELQRASLHGQDRRVFYPIKARTLTKFGGGVSVDGRPILTLGINDTLELDLAIPLERVSELSKWFASLARSARNKPKAKSN
jgi:hypothetical protein